MQSMPISNVTALSLTCLTQEIDSYIPLKVQDLLKMVICLTICCSVTEPVDLGEWVPRGIADQRDCLSLPHHDRCVDNSPNDSRRHCNQKVPSGIQIPLMY